MHCPNCGRRDLLAVKETRQRPDGSIRRRRRCSACGLDFHTAEHISNELLQIRKSDGRVVPFDRARIHKGIVKAAVGPHHADRVSELVQAIAQEAIASGRDGVLESSVLAQIVLRHLKEFHPVTHVRFALTQVGRLDRPKHWHGWSSADDVRRWLRLEYPDLEYFRPSPRLETVVKKDGRREPFDRHKLERSIGVAAKGRGESDEEVRIFATEAANAVIEDLFTQAIVTSGQIAAAIIAFLRQHDHIASLRFASTAKQFLSVEDYETEALGLR